MAKKNKLEKRFSKSLKADEALRKKKAPELTEEQWLKMYNDYLEGKSPKTLSKENNRSHQNIRLNFRKRNWPVRNQKEAGINRTKTNPNFDGKRLIQDLGYKKRAIVKRNGKSVKESHAVYCDNNNLNSIPEGYDIHHKNFNELNNNIENLQLIEHSEHTKLHWRLGKNR